MANIIYHIRKKLPHTGGTNSIETKTIDIMVLTVGLRLPVMT
jgi:hypothetical protein